MYALYAKLERSYAAKFAVATAAHALVLYASLFLVPSMGGSGASLVWPVAAINLALVWYWGYELWPAIVASFFIVLLPRGIHPALTAATAVGNVLEASIVVYLLRNYTTFSPMFARLRDSLSFMVAAVVATFASASIIATGVYVFNQRPVLNTTLLMGIWVGHAVSLIAFGSFALRWLYRPLFSKTSAEIVEGVAVFGSIATINILLFWTPYGLIGGISLVYVLIIPLIWAALRTGPRGITLALFLMSLIAATGVLYGFGPMSSNPNPAQALFGTQLVIGTLSLIFLLFTSITEERKEAVINLESHVEELERALNKISSEDQAKSDFIAILAHELRNPLSPILSGIELLKQDGKAPQEVLAMMGAHVNTAARLLDDLLDISRISQKKFKLQKESVGIRAILEHALEMVRPQLDARQHTLELRLPQDDIQLSADPVRLTQMFVNLLNNAVKYTDPGGRIEFAVERMGSDIVATVRDSGVGISPERIEKIFEPFGGGEQGGHRPGGLRIGLSLARRMAEMHHGSISAHSQGPGTGSTFVVRLPLPPIMQLPLETAAGARGRGRFSKTLLEESAARPGLKILLVDDNEPAAQGLKLLLERHGHTVEVAYDAPPALQIAESFKPDVAILDIGLPTMDGYALGQEMRQRFGDTVMLIALTGYGQSADKHKASAAGFAEYLVKPVSVSDIERILMKMR